MTTVTTSLLASLVTSSALFASATLLVAGDAPSHLPTSKTLPRANQPHQLPRAKTTPNSPRYQPGKSGSGKKAPGKTSSDKTSGKKTSGKQTSGKNAPSKTSPSGKKRSGASATIQPLPGARQVSPLQFRPLLSRAQIARLARVAAQTQQHGAQTRDDPSAVRTVATLTAAQPREGDFSLSFQCAFVDTRSAMGQGEARFPHRVLEFCRQDGTSQNPGVTVDFVAEPDSVYSVDCNSAAATMFEIRHKVGRDPWSAPARVNTRSPSDFLFIDEGGPVSVEMVFDPPDNRILTQGIRTCRVRKIG